MAESLEEAKQEGRLVVPEEDKQENAVVSIETVQSKSDKPKKKRKLKLEKMVNKLLLSVKKIMILKMLRLISVVFLLELMFLSIFLM